MFLNSFLIEKATVVRKLKNSINLVPKNVKSHNLNYTHYEPNRNGVYLY